MTSKKIECIYCFDEGVRVSPNPNCDGEYEECPRCKQRDKNE